MELREVYEASKGKPWECKELSHWRGRFYHDQVYDNNPTCGVPLPDSLASAAMEQAMVRWLRKVGFNSFVWSESLEGKPRLSVMSVQSGTILTGGCDSEAHALLLACQSLHGGAKRE